MRKRTLWPLLATGAIVALGATPAFAALSGAIFTTTSDGSRVNANIYPTKEAVYLDGGPGPNAPVGAAGLPAGDYYFQVTDPAGKELLSADPISSRKIHVSEAGVITSICPAIERTKYQNKWYGTHESGVDLDHGGLPWKAITVQLMPYKDTPNNGGVYKVWITPVEKYSPGSGKWGFVPSDSKTDNFKVKARQVTPPRIIVRKFCDTNANGVWDEAEDELFDWTVSWKDPIDNPYGPELMPKTIYNVLPAGTWCFTEEMKDAWFQTCAYVDKVKLPNCDGKACVTVLGDDGEVHEIWFGNAPKGCMHVFKYRDSDLDGAYDEGEDPLEGVEFRLTGKDLWGEPVDITKLTAPDGYARFCGLLPSDSAGYTIAEVVPEDSFPTTATSWTSVLKPGEKLCRRFGNARFGCVYVQKFYDKDCDGKKDEGEGPVSGIWFKLEGTTYKDDPVDPLYGKTNESGCVKWCKLYPGNYTITEIFPPDHWEVTTPNPQTVTLGEGAKVGGAFGNICWKTADFNTKGFWHNKNGLEILAEHLEDWIPYVNGLAPYAGNPFDGYDESGQPVPAAKNVAGETIAPAGSVLAEISNFLVASNSTYQQLEQQLLAFIFNAKYAGAGAIEGPSGWKPVEWFIDSAIDAWRSSDTGDNSYWAGVLGGYNESDCVKVLCCVPCPVPPDYFSPPS